MINLNLKILQIYFTLMIAVVDTCYFINKENLNKNISKIVIPTSVNNELISRTEHYNLFKYMVELRDPGDEYVNRVMKEIKNKHFNLSQADIEIVALTLELHVEMNDVWIGSSNIGDLEEVICLTNDNGIKSALRLLNLYNDDDFVTKMYKLRCFTCYSMYEEDLDFCKKCGYSTLTRVTVLIDKDNNEKVLLKKNYVFKNKVIKDSKGVEIKSVDQREYAQYKKNKNRKPKKFTLSTTLGDII